MYTNNVFQQKLSTLEQQLKFLTNVNENHIKSISNETLYLDLHLEENLLQSNIDNLKDIVLPQITQKIESIKNEIQELEQKKIKLDSMIKGFKNLSLELDLKMEVNIFLD